MDEQKYVQEGHRIRLLQRYLTCGVSGLDEHELLELLLHFAIPYRDTKQQAKTLIAYFGGIDKVFEATAEEIESAGVPHVKKRAAALITLFRDIKTYIAETDPNEQTQIRNTDEAARYVVPLFEGISVEKFYIVCLNQKSKILCRELVSEGTNRSVEIIMNKIINAIITSMATKVLLAHNHPSEMKNPSLEDVVQTQYITKRLSEMEIGVEDHIIVVGNDYISMKERGFI